MNSQQHRTIEKATVSETKRTTTSTRRQSPAVRPPGRVAFVGGGPGDPELLTVRAVELLRAADVVITEVPGHADMVRTLLGLPAPRVVVAEDGTETEEPAQGGPELVDGGFGTDGQPLTHAARAKVVVRLAKSGRRVVRLMAGDPFVFASGPRRPRPASRPASPSRSCRASPR